MLGRLEIHLKNVILFKFVLYTLLIVILSTLLPLFQDELKESLKNNKLAEDSLLETIEKLHSIANSERKILEVAKRYKKVLNISDKQSCEHKSGIKNSVMKLANKYNLLDPITITISQLSIVDDRILNNSQVKIKNYTVDVNYISPDFEKSLSIANEIYSLMPSNTIMLNMMIENNEVLDPVAISRLSNSKIPNFIHSKIEMRIREIVINK